MIIPFLNAKTIRLKYNVLDYLVKYPELQKQMLLLLDYIQVKDVTNLFLALEDYDKDYLLPRVLNVITQSIKSKSRKKIGNFIKIFKEIRIIGKEEWLKIISYTLYHSPLVPDAIKNNIVPVPTNYNEIANYESEFFSLTTDPMLKHYRLTKEEVYYLTNKYSKGYLFINIINHLNIKNKEKDYKKSYKILEVYKEIQQIRQDYNNKLSYELKKTINTLQKSNNKIVKENYAFYTSREKYKYLILESGAMTYDNYIEYIRDISSSIKTTLLTDDNIAPQNGIYFSYSNLGKNSLKDIDEDSYYLNKYTTSKNSNILTLPDNILVIEDNTEDLSLIVEAIKYYKTFKPYKELRIILINKEDLFNKVLDNYQKKMTISNLSKCMRMLSENDYKYSITPIISTLYKHLKTKDKIQVNRILKEYHIDEEYLAKFD